MLIGQGYHIPHGVVTNEWSNGGIMISRGKLKNSEKNLFQCHFVHHKSLILYMPHCSVASWDLFTVKVTRYDTEVNGHVCEMKCRCWK
jgi:hypothetical protein